MQLLGLNSHTSWLDTRLFWPVTDRSPGTKHSITNFGEDVPTPLAAALGLGSYTILLGAL